MEKFKKDKIKHDDNSRYKDSKLSIFPLIESIKIYISKSYRNFKADDNRSFTQSYFSDAVKLLLDTYPNAAAAYSLRKLSTSYQGPAIRVRRSSDNQEQDIYFDSLSNLDTNSLTSFVGIGGNGFVTTWYNQKGSAANLVQTTAANQPSIVVSGVIQTELGKPVILFGGGTTIALNLATPYTFSSSVFSKSIVSKYTGSGFVTVRESAWGSSGTLVAQYYTDHFRHYVAGFASNQYMINDPATPGPSLALHNITHTHTFGGSLDDGIPQLISYYRNANKAAISLSSNKDQWTTNILFSPTPATSTTAYSYVSAEVIYWDGNLEESMDAIRKNVNQYYSIY
ncbi:MAG: hypothetical protein ACK5XN_39700 [Bacteroidota bacterium]|jgi:hypothetical protein